MIRQELFNMKILIIEDSTIQAMVLETQLNKIGFKNTYMAHNASAAIHSISEIKPDLLLVDINLGAGESGIDVVEQTKNEKKRSVIFISGNTDIKHMENAKKSGFHGFLTKPIHFSDLEKLIAELPVN